MAIAVVKDFMIGPTHIQIDDSMCVSDDEAQEILKNLAKKIQPHIYYAEGKKREKHADNEMNSQHMK